MDDRWLELLERWWVRALLVAAALVVCGYYLMVAASRDQVDLGVYRAGGAAIFHGLDLYHLRFPPVGLPFTYPPLTAMMFVPIAWAPLRVVQILWMAGSLVGTWFFVRLTLRRYAGGIAATSLSIQLAVFVAVAMSDPLRIGLALGQINVIVALLVVADFCGALPRLPRGVMIGVAAAIKLTPLFLIGYFLAIGKHRRAGVTAATFATLTALGAVLAPTASANYWFHGVVTDPARVGGIGFISNQTVNGIIIRALGGPTHAKLFWLPAALLGGLCVLWTARRIEPERPWLAESVAMAGMLVISPVSWIHHWILVLPLLVACLRLARDQHAIPLLCATLLLIGTLMARAIWWVPNYHNREYHENPGQFLLGSIDILLLLAVLGIVMFTMAVGRQEAPGSAEISLEPAGGPSGSASVP